jgi:hypothetical protein
MNDLQGPIGPIPGKRTTTVTVCCVLLFLFGAFALFGNLSDWLAPPPMEEVEARMAETMEAMQGFMPGTPEGEEAMAMVEDLTLLMAEKTSAIGLLKTFATMGAFVGGVLLWRMRRVGFHVYLLSAIVWAFAPMFVMGANMVSWTIAVMYGIVVLVFALLFASQRKYML